MASDDIRWIQRLSHFCKALGQLERFLAKGSLNELEEQGLIQAFEYTFELAWNLVKDYFEAQGDTGIMGSRDAFRLGFRRGLIEDGDIWMDMIRSRSLSSHTYNEATAKHIASAVSERYVQCFQALRQKMVSLREAEG